MNKIDNAWAILQRLTPREQDIAADAILDYAAAGPQLSDEAARVVEQRLADPGAATLSPAELRSRIEKLLP